MVLLRILTLLLLFGCYDKRPKTIPNNFKYNLQLHQAVNEFKMDAIYYHVPLDWSKLIEIRFRNTDDIVYGSLGITAINQFGDVFVFIKPPELWNPTKYSYSNMREVLYHELGHAILHREHTTDGIMKCSGLHKNNDKPKTWRALVKNFFLRIKARPAAC